LSLINNKFTQEERIMTTVANNLNEQLFQELNDDTAANLSGGAASLYENGDFSGRRLDFKTGTDNLGFDVHSFDNQTSAIKISEGEKWNFYDGKNQTKYLATLGPGSYNYYDLIAKGIPNDSITSLKISPNPPS
jgi:hypothetical protein